MLRETYISGKNKLKKDRLIVVKRKERLYFGDFMTYYGFTISFKYCYILLNKFILASIAVEIN